MATGDKGNLTMFFHHKKEADRVVIELSVGDLPALTVEMTPDNFFRLIGAVVKTAVPFIEKVKTNIGDARGKDVKVEFSTAEWESKMGGEK